MYVINCEFSGVNARIKAFSSGEGGSQRLTDEEGKNSSNNGYKVEIFLSSSTAGAVPLLRWRRLIEVACLLILIFFSIYRKKTANTLAKKQKIVYNKMNEVFAFINLRKERESYGQDQGKRY